MINFQETMWAAVGGGGVLGLQLLVRLLLTDVAKRITASLWGIRAFDIATGWLIKNPVWSGVWELTWQVKSKNFAAQNSQTGRLYRCFKSVALVGAGITASGENLPYVFIGKLSHDNSILTGTWFDKRGAVGGYHGVFQIWLQGTDANAKGIWAGFSTAKGLVRSDVLTWKRIRD